MLDGRRDLAVRSPLPSRVSERLAHHRERPLASLSLIAGGTILAAFGTVGHSAAGLLGFPLIALGICWMPRGWEVKLPVAAAFAIAFALILSGALG